MAENIERRDNTLDTLKFLHVMDFGWKVTTEEELMHPILVIKERVSDGTWALSGIPTARAWWDMSASDTASGDFTFVTEGTINGDNGFVCTSNGGSDTVGTHNLSFTQFSGGGLITDGDGLDKTGNTFSVTAAQTTITSIFIFKYSKFLTKRMAFYIIIFCSGSPKI